MTRQTGQAPRAGNASPLPPAAGGPTEAAAVAGRLAEPLARRVRALRARHGMTRAQLSARSGVSPAYLARLEAATANISLQVLEALADALGVTPTELLADEPDPPEGPLRQAIDFLRRQPADVQAQVWQWLQDHFGAAASTPAADGPPRRIALIGLRGAGKSTLGARLARERGLPFVELNREIERAGGVAVSEVFTLYGAAGYRALERQCLKDVIARHREVVLATGGGLVTDAGTYELLRGAFRTVWLRARAEDHFERVRRQQDARIAAPALQAVAMANIRTMLAAREPLYAMADLVLDTSGQDVARSLRQLVALLEDSPARRGAPPAA